MNESDLQLDWEDVPDSMPEDGFQLFEKYEPDDPQREADVRARATRTRKCINRCTEGE